MTELVHRNDDRAIAVLTLDSSGNRNALSRGLVAELTDHLDAAEADASIRAIVVSHTGTTFCAGADLKEQAAEGGPAAGTGRVVALLRRVVELRKPVIARIDGHVRAGGVGLVGACDVALAGPRATFAFTEVRLGLAPAIISLTTLGRMDQRSAERFMLTGETFHGSVAAGAGLVTAAPTDLDAEMNAVCEALRAASPQGLAETKPLTTSAIRARFDTDADTLQALSQRLFESAEAREGMRAFLEKRVPSWAPA